MKDITKELEKSSLSDELKQEVSIIFSNTDLTYEQKLGILKILEDMNKNKCSCYDCSSDSNCDMNKNSCNCKK